MFDNYEEEGARREPVGGGDGD